MTPIEILHDGESFLAVNKPAGLSTQAPPGGESLESRLRQQLQSRSDYLAFPHRLDRPVSGVILLALTKRAARLLSDQFAIRKIRKTYLAWVDGKFTDDQTRWEDWIRKIPDQPRGEVCDELTQGARQAQTAVQFLRYESQANRTLLRLDPITGRMHQLRIQAAMRGHAIVGDATYEDPRSSLSESPPLISLHAYAITFHDPRNGREITVECPKDDFPLTV